MSETTNLKLFKQDNPTTNTNNFDIEKTLNENWDKLDENAGTTNKKLESLEKVDSTTNETITTIQEEQTTQNENIEKNAEGIAQNKKDVDEELTKIKKENSLLKSQIPTGTASGNSIHLEDSSNMDFEWKLRGKSYQKVKPYNNLVKNADFKSDLNEWKASSKFSVVNKNGIKYLKISTSMSGFNRAYQGLNTIVGHKYYVAMKCIKDKAWVSAELFLSASLSDNYPQPAKGIASNIYQKETSVSTILVPKSSNCSIGVMFQSSNTDEVWEAYFRDFICIDLTELYGEGNEPDQTTCDNLFTFDKVAYGTSPSSYTLSQIQNVGDNVNLAYISSKTDYNYSSTLEKDAVLINGTSRNAGNIVLYLNGDDGITLKANKKYIVSLFFDGDVTGNGYKTIYLQGMPIGDIASNKMITKEIILSEDKVCKTINLDLSANCTFDNMKVKVMITENGKLKEYIPYNCIKATICNKNLYKVEKVINDSNTPRFTFLREGNVEFTTGAIPLIIAPTTIKEKTEYTYILKCKSNVTTENNINFTGIYEDGTSELLSANKKKDTNEFIVKFKTNKEKTLAYVTQQYTNSAGVTIITEGTMILEGDYLNLEELYEIHQEQEIIFPLAKGQKLYKGSYLEKDGIHNTRRQVVLTGNENIFESQLGTYQTFGIVISGIKQDAKLMSNYFTSYPTITDIKYKVGMTNNNAANRLYISNGESSKTEEFKAWLSQRFDEGIPVIIEYELTGEEIIPYTQEQQAVIDKILYTYKNVTNISVDNELATLDITYKKDIETMFNNQAKEYNERLSNIESLLNTTETSALLLDNLENDLKEEV